MVFTLRHTNNTLYVLSKTHRHWFTRAREHAPFQLGRLTERKNIDTSISQNHFHMKHSHARTLEHTCFRVVPVKLYQRHVFFNYPEVRVIHIVEAITVVMFTDA